MIRNWIVFGTAGDSIEVSVPQGAVISTNRGAERDAQHDNVPYFRHRLKTGGIVLLSIFLNDSLTDPVQYSLRLWRDRNSRTALQPTGAGATLVIDSQNTSDRFAVIPLSVAKSVVDLTDWDVERGTYRVVLVADSLYQVCRLPCVIRDVVKLSPFAAVTIRQ
jgi:hypothetical protein